MEKKKIIYDFVLDYLKFNCLEKLNFSIISKGTNISRTTLYSYYNGMWELVDEINLFYINQMAEIINDFPSTYNSESNKKNTIILLNHIFENKNYYYVASKLQKGNEVLIIKEILKDKRNENNKIKEMDLYKAKFIENFFTSNIQFVI